MFRGINFREFDPFENFAELTFSKLNKIREIRESFFPSNGDEIECLPAKINCIREGSSFTSISEKIFF